MYCNAIYAQSGGVTAVINSSAHGVINACHRYKEQIKNLYIAKNGILGVLQEQLLDSGCFEEDMIAKLRYTPGGAFGSCRYKLKSLKENRLQYERLIEVFREHQVGYFFYNGGNDSADTCLKVSQIADELSYPIKAIHVPKTIDNDLVITDNCPGFGSVAKYVATSICEVGLDLKSMCLTSTKVFILEVMGRNTGWIAASSGLASDKLDKAPHVILFPEVIFDEDKFIDKVANVVGNYGYCVVVTAEGLKNKNGNLLSVSSDNSIDNFGHQQLGGVAPILANLIKNKLGLKYHWAVADYLQRSARHIASKTDVEQAYKLGYRAVEIALSGKNAVMPYIKRLSQYPYTWGIEDASLTEIANKEKTMPLDFISEDGFYITQKCKDYLLPLIDGEDYPPFFKGLPDYADFSMYSCISPKLQAFIN